jgi:hypothetical protein
MIYGVVSPAPASFASTSICLYVVCAFESLMFRLDFKGTCTSFYSRL